eukprot:327936_1
MNTTQQLIAWQSNETRLPIETLYIIDDKLDQIKNCSQNVIKLTSTWFYSKCDSIICAFICWMFYQGTLTSCIPSTVCSLFVLIALSIDFVNAQLQPITYTDLSCNGTYHAQVPANFTQYFRFSVPTDTTNAVQIDLCNSNFDTVVEIYKYKTDNVDDYLDSTDNYIAKNDDWDQSSKYGCPFNTSSIASY